MNIKKIRKSLFLPLTAMLLFLTIDQSLVFGDYLYKNYIVKQDKGIEILCDSYIVQPNDWVFKVFKQKGEISGKDYPEFLQIFKRINPHIYNPDLIRPGQAILIPLKKLAPGDLPGQSKGIVTIPFIGRIDPDEVLSKQSVKYQVKNGDCVSKIISKKFGEYGTLNYSKKVKLFRHLNPDIKNLNAIYVGSYVNLPDPSMKNKPWYKSIFIDSGNIVNYLKPKKNMSTPALDSVSSEITTANKKDDEKSSSPLSQAVNAMEAQLINKGNYYFPAQTKKDHMLDLALFPIIELEWGKKIVCSLKKTISEDVKYAISSCWKDVKFISISANDSPQIIINSIFEAAKSHNTPSTISFQSNGITSTIKADWVIEKSFNEDNQHNSHKICIFLIENCNEKTHPSISRYLALHNIIVKDHLVKKNNQINHESEKSLTTYAKNNVVHLDTKNNKTFIKSLVSALEFEYTPNASISFQYAGMQLQSVLSQISTETGVPLLVDFGDIYGDAMQAIKDTGFNIIQIYKTDDYHSIITKLLTALNLSFTANPDLLVANRPESSNISLSIPGFMISKNKTKFFVPSVSLPTDVISFLNNKGIKILTAIQNKAYNL